MSKSSHLDEEGAASAKVDSKNDSFKGFCQLCDKLANESSYNAKTELVKDFISDRTTKGKYEGDIYLLIKFLLPSQEKRVYNLKDKQISKLFSQIFQVDSSVMISDLEKGNVSETVKKFFKESEGITPSNKSTLTLQEVDKLLDELAAVSKEDEQLKVLKKIAKRCTTHDLKYIVRLIKHDLRMNTGTKHVLDALDPNAYAAYQASSNLKAVVEKWKQNKAGGSGIPGLKKNLSIKATLMTPVKPMLAEACKSTGAAMKKCPNGIYSEIKYDGERVQVHKQGNKFEYYSRSLKTVQPHKVAEIKDFLPKACPHGDSLILDGEILLVDNKTGKPLPFGTLGIHKKSAFKDASCCYVIFDILQFNDDNLMKRPIHERRDILKKNVTEIKNHIILSEMTHITKESELQQMLKRVFAENLEGLVLKDLKSVYEPGKRHWLKMKKDYLQEGAMADSADLVVLGAYYGTGNKGGMMSVFLMGCYDASIKQWVTVAKCGNGHDDKTIARLQKELDVVKISKDASKVPSWLDVNKTLVPDFVVADPKKAPVWEISGAEFSKSSTHTADGISIRFPRVTKIRDDKDWKTATNLPTLKQLYENSKKTDDEPKAGSSKSVDEDEDEDDDEAKGSKSNKKSKQKGTSPKTKNEDQPKQSTNQAKGRKRASDDNDNEDSANGPSPNKKSKPACKYGSKCYQKNASHLEKYSHPTDNEAVDNVQKRSLSIVLKADRARHQVSEDKQESSKTDKESTKKDDLPDLFGGLKFLLTDELHDTKKLKRYIVAYDGDIIDDCHKSSATHIISTDKGTSAPAKAVVVTPEWVWKSVKRNKVQPTDEYAPV